MSLPPPPKTPQAPPSSFLNASIDLWQDSEPVRNAARTQTVAKTISQLKGVVTAEKLQGDCPICLEKLDERDLAVADCCKKLFHWTGCLKPWLENPVDTDNCPECRGEVRDFYHKVVLLSLKDSER